MTSKLKEELEGKGIKVIQTWHIIFAFVGMIFVAGVSYGINQSEISSIKVKTANLEKWKDTHINEVKTIQIQLEKRNAEIQVNLKVLMESQGLKYQIVE